MPIIKNYEIPLDIKNILIDWRTYLNLKENYTKVPFGFKKAVKCSKKAEQYLQEYWNKVFELYPELKNKKINVDNILNIYIIEE